MLILNYIPYYYFVKTRLEGLQQKISWVFVYFIPGIYLYSCFQDVSSARSFFVMVIAITLVNYVYEDGYIFNDVKTVKKEKEPTLRLSEKEFSLLENNFWKLVLIRFLISCFLLVFFRLLTDSNLATLKLAIVVVITKFLFSYYNSIRNFFNLILIFPLSFLRFYGYILPFIQPNAIFEFLIIASFLYPLTKAIEFTRLPRYGLPILAKIVGPVDFFRVKYYFILSLFLGSLSLLFLFKGLNFYLNISVYYFLYRLATYIATGMAPELLAKKKSQKKDYFRNS